MYNNIHYLFGVERVHIIIIHAHTHARGCVGELLRVRVHAHRRIRNYTPCVCH